MSHDPYSDIYSLRPLREDPRGGTGWYKLQWRPIWRKTVSVYLDPYCRQNGIGLTWWRSDAANGWNRSFNCLHVRLVFLIWNIDGWIKWDYIVHKDGPSDSRVQRPLDLSGIKS